MHFKKISIFPSPTIYSKTGSVFVSKLPPIFKVTPFDGTLFCSFNLIRVEFNPNFSLHFPPSSEGIEKKEEGRNETEEGFLFLNILLSRQKERKNRQYN